LRKDIQCLEGVQRSATKLVPALRKLDYGQIRLQKLGLISLETRRRMDDLIARDLQNYDRQGEAIE